MNDSEQPKQSPPDAPPAPAHEIAERVKSGEYFREMQNMYASLYLAPMTERYFYMFYTGVCVLILLVMTVAFARIFPISADVPFVYNTNEMFEYLPIIHDLKQSRREDINIAIKRFLVSEYVRRRESYDITTLDNNVRFIKAQSEPGIFEAFQHELDPGNPESPIAQFQRHSKRLIEVVQVTPNTDGTMDVAFEASVENSGEGPSQPVSKPVRVMATLAFQYTDVTIDQHTGKPTPLHFLVTQYRTRRLQE